VRGPLLRDPVLRPAADRRGARLPPPRRRRRRPRRLRGPRHPHEPDHGPRQRGDQRRLEARGRRGLRRALRAHPAAHPARGVVGVAAAVRRRRPRLLLVPPRLAREPPVLGEPRRAPLEPPLQPLDRAAADVGADDVPPVLAAAPAARLPGLDGPARAVLEPDLPVLDPHGAHPDAARVGRADLQHAVAPSRPPRGQPPLPRQELRRHPHRLGPAVRHLGARDGARPLRADDQSRLLPPAARRLPRVRGAVARRARHRGVADPGAGAPARPGLEALGL
ncbi:MAG: Fatty acid hydroxylase family (carotene hydroxylase/sterol desaturase), partial [uncultured Solirubrobacteraceae bacterium]